MFENSKKLNKFRKIITRKGVEVVTNNNKQNREISRKKLIMNAQPNRMLLQRHLATTMY